MLQHMMTPTTHAISRVPVHLSCKCLLNTRYVLFCAAPGLAQVCHPDMLGEAGHNLCILLNEVGWFYFLVYAPKTRTNPSPPVHL